MDTPESFEQRMQNKEVHDKALLSILSESTTNEVKEVLVEPQSEQESIGSRILKLRGYQPTPQEWEEMQREEEKRSRAFPFPTKIERLDQR